ncbi:MAG TPA: hypothetical protein VML55_22085 [Planctomycetaceae bacterium]|nr:hypothetical protein [Planctomycetaceae bacterium]
MPNQLTIRPPAAPLERGRTVAVPIVLSVEQALKVRGIHARFWGAEETQATYTTTSTDSKGHTTTHTHTAVEHVNIVEQQSVLAGNEPQGFFRSLGDAVATLFGGGAHEVFAPGEYPFEIDVTVPGGAPPTHTGQKSRVFYELSARVDVPLGFDLKASHAFELAPVIGTEPEVQPVHVRYPDDSGRGLWDSLFAPDVRIELALATDTARHGEVIDGIVVIESEKPLSVRALIARCTGVERSRAHGHDDTAQYSSQPVDIGNPGLVQGRYSERFSLPVELAGPPTRQGKLFSIEWFVQVQLDVPWAKDPRIRAPVWLLED